MCLTIDPHFHPDNKPLIAETNIHVYKIIKYNRSTRQAHSYYQDAVLPLNELLPQVDVLPIPSSFNQIHQGYHAFFYLKNARKNVVNSLTTFIKPPLPLFIQPILAVIPKGTKYYIGINFDIVAEQMILKVDMYELGIKQSELMKFFKDNDSFESPELTHVISYSKDHYDQYYLNLQVDYIFKEPVGVTL